VINENDKLFERVVQVVKIVLLALIFGLLLEWRLHG
jgi:hypothetical protein